jgi:hypothetical protein
VVFGYVPCFESVLAKLNFSVYEGKSWVSLAGC